MTWKYLACLPGEGPSRVLPPRLLTALRREGCASRLQATGLLLFASPDLPVRKFQGSDAVAIGHLFDRSGAPAPPALATKFEQRTAEPFVSEFWGSYVVLTRGAGSTGTALRDASGALPCYHAQTGSVHWFTSVPHLLIDCGLLPATFDWPVTAASLTQHAARSSETALRGIDEVLPGTLLSFSASEPRRDLVWNARAHATREPPPDAAASLRAALDITFAAWGRCVERPLIEVSGGLDSALVAAGFAAAVPRSSLITFAAAAGDPDETAYAKAIADHLGLALEIAMPRIEDVDLSRSLSGDLPRPNARAFAQAADARSLAHARAIGADAFASGGGGDDVFCYLRTILPAVDRLRVQGPRGMAATARDIAAMNHATYWEAASRMVRRLLRGRSSRRKCDLRLLTPAAAELASPSIAFDIHLPERPGKEAHLEGILSIHNYLEGHARAEFAPILSPLLSQPVVECCLAIPAWQWCEGGRNRAVAREAYADRLPRTVIERRSKGSFDGFCTALLEANRGLVRAMLLEGRLAREGLLDRAAVAAALDQPFPLAESVARLLALVDVESWLTGWSRRTPHSR